ncbi:hypothetical protein GCM10017687_82380 [Streptomyces echinatus]
MPPTREGVKPQLVTSWPQYERVYGGFAPDIVLPHAVKGFFENGGSSCYIVRIPAGDTGTAQRALPAAGRPEVESLVVSAREVGGALDVVVETEPPAEGEQPQSFAIKVNRDGTTKEHFTNLTFGKGTQNVVKVVNDQSELIRVETRTVPGLSPADRMPAPGSYAIEPSAPAAITATPADLAGSETTRTGYEGLAIAEDVSIVAIPDLITVCRREDGTVDEELYLAAQRKLVDWCELKRSMMGDRRLAPRPQRPAGPGLARAAGRGQRVRGRVLPARRRGQPQGPARRDQRGAVPDHPAERTRRRRLGAHRRGPGGLEGPGQRGHPGHRPAGDRGDHRRAGRAEPEAGQLSALVRRQRPAHLGCAHPGVPGPELALRQRTPALHLHRGDHPPRHPVGGVRAQRQRPVGQGSTAPSARSCTTSGCAARWSVPPRSRRSSCCATRPTTRRVPSTRGS